MKRAMFLMLVALLVATALLSAPVQGQEKTSVAVGIIVDPATIQPGEKSAISIVGTDIKKVTCNGDSVGTSFFLSPATTQTYTIHVWGKEMGEEAVQVFTIQVGERLRFTRKIGPFLVGKSGLTELEPGAKTATDLKRDWDLHEQKNPGVDYDFKYRSSSDTQGNGSLKRNTQLATERGQNGRDYMGKDGEIIKRVQVDDRMMEFEAIETDASFYRRMGRSVFKGGSQVAVRVDTFRIQMKSPVVKTPKPKTDRLRLTVGAGYSQSPVASLGLRIPLNQDSVKVKSDVHPSVYFGYDGKDFTWAVSVQVDFRLGRGFYIGPLLMGGESVPDFGGDFNHADAGFGPIAQFRPTNKLVIEAAALLNYRTFFRWDDGEKSQPDEVGAKILMNAYYAF